MKSLLDKGFIGMDMPPLPDDLWKGIRLLPLTETFVYSTSSDTYATWSIPENEPITTQGEYRCNGIIRWYDPITGRWLSNDPIGISGGLNQYVFCGDNPVNFRDPFGLCTDKRSGQDYLNNYLTNLNNDWGNKSPWNPLNWWGQNGLYDWSQGGGRELWGYDNSGVSYGYQGTDYVPSDFGNYAAAYALTQQWGAFTADAICTGVNMVGFVQSWGTSGFSQAIQDTGTRKYYQSQGISAGSYTSVVSP